MSDLGRCHRQNIVLLAAPDNFAAVAYLGVCNVPVSHIAYTTANA